jgi:hypothetical protein
VTRLHTSVQCPCTDVPHGRALLVGGQEVETHNPPETRAEGSEEETVEDIHFGAVALRAAHSVALRAACGAAYGAPAPDPLADDEGLAAGQVGVERLGSQTRAVWADIAAHIPLAAADMVRAVGTAQTAGKGSAAAAVADMAQVEEADRTAQAERVQSGHCRRRKGPVRVSGRSPRESPLWTTRKQEGRAVSRV